MIEYRTVRLTKKEYILLDSIQLKVAEKGLPLQILENQELDKYLASVNRKTLSKGALTGLGLKALLYLIDNKDQEE